MESFFFSLTRLPDLGSMTTTFLSRLIYVGHNENHMETLGIALGILGGLFAAPAFCFALVKFSPFLPRLLSLTHSISIGALALFAVELVLVAFMGSVQVRALIGPAFFPLHAILTLGAAPALACVLLLGQRNFSRWWLGVAAICWVVGVFAIFYQYSVSETLYGPDGIGGPYGSM